MARGSRLKQKGGKSVGAGMGLLIMVAWLLAIGVYFLPAILGFAKHKHNAGAILVLDLFLGWSYLLVG